MMPLAGRRILLIGIGFYDYEEAIARQFRALGADIWVENEQPPEVRGRIAPLRRLLTTRNDAAVTRHLHAMRMRARAMGRLDAIIAIKGMGLDEEFLQGLRADHPGVRLIVYHWDSMTRFPYLRQRLDWFDRVLTFDHADAASDSRFILRPNFYRPECTRAPTAPAPTIDISFVGWLHHQRLNQIEQLRAQADELGLVTDLYLSTGLWTKTKLTLQRHGRGIHARQQPFDRYVSTSMASRAILDLPHPQQTGLTMRAIDAVGMGRKLITTSGDIVRYDFYRPENVAVINAAAPRIDPAFLDVPMAPLPPALVERYSLRGWALDVFGTSTSRDFVRTA